MLPPIIRMTETASRQMKASGDGVLTPPVIEGIEFVNYVDEGQLDDVMRLVGQDLSEPYSSELVLVLSHHNESFFPP